MAGYTGSLAAVVAIARELSGTDSNGLTNQKAFDFSNASMLKMRKQLIRKGVDAANVQETLGTITDGVGEYLYPSDIWLPKEMEINWWNPTAGTTTANVNYVPVGKAQDTNLPAGATIGWLRQNQSFNRPVVDFRGDYFEIMPTPLFSTWGGASGGTIANAIRFFYYLQPTLFTDNTNLTDVLTYPESVDYHAFAKVIAAHYDYSIGKIDQPTLDKIIQAEVDSLVQMIQGGGAQVVTASSVPWTGWEF